MLVYALRSKLLKRPNTLLNIDVDILNTTPSEVDVFQYGKQTVQTSLPLKISLELRFHSDQ